MFAFTILMVVSWFVNFNWVRIQYNLAVHRNHKTADNYYYYAARVNSLIRKHGSKNVATGNEIISLILKWKPVDFIPTDIDTPMAYNEFHDRFMFNISNIIDHCKAMRYNQNQVVLYLRSCEVHERQHQIDFRNHPCSLKERAEYREATPYHLRWWEISAEKAAYEYLKNL